MQARLPFEPERRTTSEEPRTFFVRHPRARRYVIRVVDDGSIRVTIPRRGSKREATAFVEREQPWIEKERRRVEQERERAQSRRANAPPPEAIREWRLR